KLQQRLSSTIRMGTGGMLGMPGGGALGMSGGGALGMSGGGLTGMPGMGMRTGPSLGTTSTGPSAGTQMRRRGDLPKRAETTPAAAKPKAPADPLADAETALKELRQHPDDKQAADRLERALQRLKEQAKPKGVSGSH